MVFDPLMYDYDPEVIEAQRELEAAQAPQEHDFGSWFTGRHDMSTDEGRQAWATIGIPGLLLSKLYSEDAQKEWFIQRNAVDLGYNQLKEIIAAYEEISKVRRLTNEEQAQYQDAIGRRELLQEDLSFVYDNFDGNLDAVIDKDGKSFNDRWGIDVDEEGDIGDLLSVFAEHPTALAGAITADVIRELPLLGVAKLLGIAHKGMDMGTLIAKVNARLNGIESKVTRGLTKLGTGVGAGAIAGAGYEGAYSALEQGEAKPHAMELGAKFGGTFGLLGGAALMLKGPKSSTVAGDLETVAPAVQAKSPREVNAIKQVETILEKTGNEKVSEIAKETSIFSEIEHEIKSIKGSVKDSTEDSPFITTDLDGRIKTVVNEALLKKAHKDVIKQIDDALKTDGDFRGVPASYIRGRDVQNLKNPDAFRMFGLAHEKAKGVFIMDANNKGLPIPDDIDAKAWTMAFNELNDLDAKRLEPSAIKQANEAATPEELEVERILKQRIEARKQSKDGEVPEVEEEVPVAKTPIADYINKNPKKSLAIGAGLGAGLAAEEERMMGAAIGVGAVLGGPGLYKSITSKSLKKRTMQVKHAMSKSVEEFGSQAKLLEFDMHVVLKKVEEAFPTPEEGRLLINAIEGNHNKLLSKPQIKVKEEVQAILKAIGDEAKKSGVIKDAADITHLRFGKIVDQDKRGHFLNNYFPHIFKTDLSEDEIQELVKVYLKKSKSADKRKILGSVEYIKKNIPKLADRIVDNPVLALQTYTSAMTRTIYSKNLLNSLEKLDISPTGDRVLPVLMSKEAHRSLGDTNVKHGGLSDQESLHYQEFEHPTLKGFVAHSDIKPLLDSHFVLIRRGGMQDIKENLLKLNNGLKRIFVFGSLFHAQALMLSMMYSLGPTGLIRGLGRKHVFKDDNGNPIRDSNGDVIEKEINLGDLKIGTNAFNELAKEAMAEGLDIIQMKTKDLVNPGFKGVQGLLEKGGYIGKQANKFAEHIDYLTWEYMHDRFKLATYLQNKHKLLEDNPGMDPVKAGRLASEFANDAYGGLNWDGFATKLYNYAQNNPEKIRGILADKMAGLVPVDKRRWLNMVLFAPDWTISNLRIVGRVFSLGYKYSEGFLKSIHRGDTAAWKSKQGQELLAAWKLYSAYTARAGAITSGLWWGMMEINNALWDNPEPTTEGLFDFWFGEDSGKMPLGGGESMVISKQISEPYHWIQHPRHTLLNKMSVVPKTVMEGMFNKQWFSLKKGFPMGPALEDPDGTKHHMQWIGGKLVPISMKPFIDPKLSFSEKLERTFTGFFGFPQYGAYYDDNVDYSDLEPFKFDE